MYRPRRLVEFHEAAMVLLCSFLPAVHANTIPYPRAGNYNSATYTFRAATTGDVIVYFAGSDASFDNELGLLDNGALTSGGFGLDDHASSIGQAFDLGTVNAGDELTFVLLNHSFGDEKAYSDPSLNVPYDLLDDTIGHNHIYATPYDASSGLLSSNVPSGLYVAFEDLRIPDSDYSYNDEDFVFTNVMSVPLAARLVASPLVDLNLNDSLTLDASSTSVNVTGDVISDFLFNVAGTLIDNGTNPVLALTEAQLRAIPGLSDINTSFSAPPGLTYPVSVTVDTVGGLSDTAAGSFRVVPEVNATILLGLAGSGLTGGIFCHRLTKRRLSKAGRLY